MDEIYNYTELIKKLPEETPEARNTRTAIYRSILNDLNSNNNLNSTLQSLESRIGANTYNSVNDFYKDVFQIIESDLFPSLLKASEQAKVSPADNAQNKIQAKQWIDGIRDAYQGAHATADFLYLFIKDMIKFETQFNCYYDMRSKNTRKFKSEQLRSKFGYLTFESIFSKFLNKIDSSIFNSLITTFYKILMLSISCNS